MICAMLLDFKTTSYTKIYNYQYSSMFIFIFICCCCCCEMKEIANEQKEGRRELKKASVKKRVNIFFFYMVMVEDSAMSTAGGIADVVEEVVIDSFTTKLVLLPSLLL